MLTFCVNASFRKKKLYKEQTKRRESSKHESLIFTF